LTSPDRRLPPAITPSGDADATQSPDPEAVGLEAQRVWAQFVHDTVHGLEKLLRAASDPEAACQQLCDPLPDPQIQLEGAVRWCGQSSPASIVHPKFDKAHLHVPLVSEYSEVCMAIRGAVVNLGPPAATAEWLGLAMDMSDRLGLARATFRQQANIQEGWTIAVNDFR
jgi:hypothetical protein